jgi:hypothetical protein
VRCCSRAWILSGPERWPVWLGGERLDWALLQQLRCSHPMAEQVAVDRVTVLRQGVVLQER